MKVCSRCRQEKSLDCFYKNRAKPDKYSAYCKICGRAWARENKDKINAYARAYRAKHPDQVKNYVRKFDYRKDFGITIGDYEVLFAEQKGCCAICGQHQSKFKRHLAVDHDHVTKKIRGLLCDPCNRGMGMLKEHNLQKAIAYLFRDRVLA